MGETRIVDNRVFLLGLDELYRKAMKTHEQGELLTAARRVAAELEVSPVERPVEGYYAEHPLLTEYFLLVRALQDVDGERASEVASLAEYNRLTEVMSSPIFGEAQWTVERSGATRFLPVGRDALSRALLLLRPAWTVESLTAAARTAAFENDDVSLVGLAARAGDALVLAALRESVVLYALVPRYGSLLWLKSLRYVWQVDRELVDAAARFGTCGRSIGSWWTPLRGSSRPSTLSLARSCLRRSRRWPSSSGEPTTPARSSVAALGWAATIRASGTTGPSVGSRMGSGWCGTSGRRRCGLPNGFGRTMAFATPSPNQQPERPRTAAIGFSLASWK